MDPEIFQEQHPSAFKQRFSEVTILRKFQSAPLHLALCSFVSLHSICFSLTVVLIIQWNFAWYSVVSIAPIVDLILHPDLQGICPVTMELIHQCQKLDLPRTLLLFIAFVLISLVVINIGCVFAKMLSLKLKYWALRTLAQETVQSCLWAKLIFFSNASQGTFLNTFSPEIGVVGGAFGPLGLLIANISQVLLLIVPLAVAWEVTLIFILLAALCTLPVVLLGKSNCRLGRENTRTGNQIAIALKENLEATKVVVAVPIARELHGKLRLHCARCGIQMGCVCHLALQSYLGGAS